MAVTNESCVFKNVNMKIPFCKPFFFLKFKLSFSFKMVLSDVCDSVTIRTVRDAFVWSASNVRGHTNLTVTIE